jgi:hypothetical protein
MVNLDRKVRRLARGLQRWSQRKVGNIRDQLLMVNKLILCLDAAQEGRPLSPGELGLRRGLKHRVLGLASLERTIARQRARVAGLRAGDANSQYFQIISSKRRRRDHIAILRMGSQVATEQATKEALTTGFYVNLLGMARPRECDLDLAAVGLQPIDFSGLEARFMKRRCGARCIPCQETNRPAPTASHGNFTATASRLSRGTWSVPCM